MKNKYFYRSLIATTTLAALLPVTGIQAVAEETAPNSAITAPNTAEENTSASEAAESDVDSTSDDSKESTAPDSSNDKESTNKATKPDAAPSPSSNNKPVATEAKESVAELAESIVNTGSLTWGIRTSFNNYTGGPTSVFDGAEKNEKNNEFTFKLEKTSYDPTTEHFEAQFKGGIQYKKYCNGTDAKLTKEELETATCDLDLKIENPRIVIDKGGSFVYAAVSSKQYGKRTTYTDTESKNPIAELITSSADFQNDGKTATWTGIPTTLTSYGNEMFSEFYYVGSGLAPISFKFDSTKHPEIKRPSFDNTKYRVSNQEFNNSTPYERHRNLYKFNGHVLVATAGYRFKQHEGSGLALLDRDLNQKYSKHLKINEYGATAFDEENGDFYFVQKQETGDRKKIFSDDKLSLYKVKVNLKTGFGDPIKVHTFKKGITAIGYHPQTKTIAVITPEELGIIKNGKIEIRDLPSASTLFAKANLTAGNHGYIYGDPNNINEPYELLAMDDGKFVLNADGRAIKDGKNVYGLMVLIDTESATADSTKILENSGTSEISLAPSAARTNGSLIVRANKNSYASLSYGQSLEYKEGAISKAYDPVQTKDIAGWGNLMVLKDGKVLALNGHNGKLEWRNAETFKLEEDMAPIAIPNGSKTYEHIHGPILQLDEGTFYVPSYDPSEGDGEEVFALRKVFDPEFDSQIDRDSHTEENVETEKTPWWTTVLSVLGALGLVGAILTFVFNFVVKP